MSAGGGGKCGHRLGRWAHLRQAAARLDVRDVAREHSVEEDTEEARPREREAGQEREGGFCHGANLLDSPFERDSDRRSVHLEVWPPNRAERPHEQAVHAPVDDQGDTIDHAIGCPAGSLPSDTSCTSGSTNGAVTCRTQTAKEAASTPTYVSTSRVASRR